MNYKELFKHIYIENKNEKTFVLFHGTGGDENDLISLAKQINSDYSVLSLRGNISEQGMNRFFERFSDGSFNMKNIEEESAKLHEFLEGWLGENNKTVSDLVFLGYSNGANFILSYIFLYQAVKVGVLLHPMLPFAPDENLRLFSTKLFITTGKQDPFTTQQQLKQLGKVLQKTGVEVAFYQHEGGHEIQQSEIEKVKEFLYRL